MSYLSSLPSWSIKTIQRVTITKKAVDPIVYQPCAYGILIPAVCGEKNQRTKCLKEYKRINNLML